MYLDGQSILDKGIVTLADSMYERSVDLASQIQPNGIDLRINRLYTGTGTVVVPTDGKTKADLTVREEQPKEGYWDLAPNHGLYWVDFLETVSVKDGHVAELITRSSLVRSGVDVVAGLWDTGFEGQLGCTLRVWQRIRIQWGAKLCQIRVAEAEFNGVRYNGTYQGTTSQTALINE